MVEAIKDQYAVEKFSEEMLRQLASTSISDVEVYWILWILFSKNFKFGSFVRWDDLLLTIFANFQFSILTCYVLFFVSFCTYFYYAVQGCMFKVP